MHDLPDEWLTLPFRRATTSKNIYTSTLTPTSAIVKRPLAFANVTLARSPRHLCAQRSACVKACLRLRATAHTGQHSLLKPACPSPSEGTQMRISRHRDPEHPERKHRLDRETRAHRATSVHGPPTCKSQSSTQAQCLASRLLPCMSLLPHGFHAGTALCKQAVARV